MISIVVPTLCEEKIIGKTLSALKSQLKMPHEIIVADGGSPDRTVEIATAHADHVVVHRGKNRQTIGQGRNDGARVARGEFLVFLDADCSMPDPDQFFRLALSNFEKIPDLVALTTFLRFLPENETTSDKLILGTINLVVLIKNNLLGKGEVPGGEFQMVRKEAFEKIGGYDESLVTREDRDLFFRLRTVGRTRCDPRLTVFHTGRRVHTVGWAGMIKLFMVNTFFFHMHGRVRSKEWTPIR